MFDNLKRVAVNELKKLDAAYAGKEEFSETDLKKFDCMAHGTKNLLTTIAMLESEEYEEGMSGARGRSPMTGRYVSRTGNQSYEEGYSRGYSEAMSNGVSGHYPYYPEPRRW